MRDLKVLYVGGLDSAQKGAVGTHTRGILQGFQSAGADIHALFLDDQVPDYFEGPTSLVRASSIHGYYKKVADRVRLARAALKKQRSFDLVYTRYDPVLSSMMVTAKTIIEYNDDFLDQIRFAIECGQFGRAGRAVRGSGLYRRAIETAERHCFNSAGLVVCVTEQLCELVEERGAAGRTFCVLNGSDATFDASLDPAHVDDTLRLGHIGTVTYWDGLKELLYGLAQFKAEHSGKSVKLLILGEGSMKPELIALSHTLALHDVVEFRPSTDFRGALRALHQVDIVPLLKTISSYGLSPIKFYEALCTGRYLLCSDISHINDVSDAHGRVVRFPLDVGEIAAAIAALHARLPEIRSGVHERAQAAQAAHSWKARVHSLIDAIEARPFLASGRGTRQKPPEATGEAKLQ